MMSAPQNWVIAIALPIILVVALMLWSKYYAKYTHSYINDVEDLSKHHDKYRLYFLVLGVFFPASEALITVFAVRDEDEFIYYLIVGILLLSIAVFSKKIDYIKINLHKIFVWFFIILNFLLFYNIYTDATKAINLMEFTIFVVFSYYAFYNIKHFYVYLLLIFVLLLGFLFADVFSTKLFILYANTCLVAFVFNYANHVIDLNIRENLVFAYNFVSKGTLLVVGVDKNDKMVFVSNNIKEILAIEKHEWIDKSWQNEILASTIIEEQQEKRTFIQKVIFDDNSYKLIEWRDESFYKDLVIKIGTDVTESRKAETELKRTKEILEQTNQIARVGGWEFDVVAQKLYSSTVTKEIYEETVGKNTDFQGAIDYFDGVESREKISKALYDCMKFGIPYDLELPIITAKGNRLFVRVEGNAELVNGTCVRIYGIVQDIDEHVKSKNALIESEQRFRFISENTSDAIIVFDSQKMIYASPAHEKQFGYSEQEALSFGRNEIFQFIHPHDKARIYEILNTIIQKRVTSITYDFRFLHKNGNYVWREDTLDIIYNDDNDSYKIIIIARDISDRRETEIESQLRQEKKLVQNEIIVRLAKTQFDENEFWKYGIQTITEAAHEGLNVSRISVWNYVENENDIVCADLFIGETHTHSSGQILSEHNFPAYFEAVKSKLAIVANDAHTHPATAEFSEFYLKSLHITSMLDVPIYVSGAFVGLMCCEQTNEPKTWTDEDVVFAHSIADVISLGIEADKRKKAETELKRTKEMLEQTSIVADIGGWEILIDSQKLYFSDINKHILEAPESFELDLSSAIDFYKKGKNREKIAKAFKKCLKKGTPFDLEVQIVTLKGNERWVRAIGQAELVDGRCKRLFGTFQNIDQQVKLNQIIKDKERQYRTLISNLSSVAFRCLNDKDWTMLFVSDAIEQITGYPASDFINNHRLSYNTIIHSEDRDYVNSQVDNSVVDWEYVVEYRIISVDNKILWVSERGKRYFDENEEAFFIDGIITNITDQKNAEAQLLENQEQLLYKSNILAAIAKTTEQLLVSKNIDETLTETFALIGEAANVDRVYFFKNDINTNRISQTIEWVRPLISSQMESPSLQNCSFEEISFYIQPLIKNKIYQQVFSEISDPRLKARWKNQGISAIILLPIFIKDVFHGFIGFDDCTHEQIWSDDKINILQSLAINIANAIERIDNEHIIEESESNFRQLTETLEDVFLLYDFVKKKYIYISPSCKNIFGFEQKSFYENRVRIIDLLLEEDKNVIALIESQIFKNNSLEVEYRIKTKDGGLKWISQKSFGIRNSKGELVRISGICTDITEKKFAQNEIKQLSLVAERTINGVLIIDVEGRVLWSNQSLLNMMEIPAEALLGKRPRDLFSTGTREFEEKTKNIRLHDSVLEIEILTYKKNKKWIQINTTAIKDDAGMMIQQIEVIIDITERKKAEQELKESEQKLNNILNSLDEIVWATSLPDYKLLFVSESFEKIYGKTVVALKKNLNIWREAIHPEDKKIVQESDYEVMNTGSSHNSFRIIDGDGKLKWIENDTKILKNEDGEPIMIMGITTDITDKKIAEQALAVANQEADTANKSKAELELRALQMQMNPHFVFNALNSIQSYIMSHDTLTANNYLSKFAHLIRLFLDSSRSKFISLAEEVRLLTLYIELEKLRFNDKFDFEIVLDANVSKYFELPTMILQPFVENAINHGLRYKKTKGLLSIRFYMESNYIICKIEDTGVGRKNVGQIQAKSSRGYQSQGLKITAERLMTYNKINEANIVFSVSDKILNPKEPDEEVGTVIEIRFPEN